LVAWSARKASDIPRRSREMWSRSSALAQFRELSLRCCHPSPPSLPIRPVGFIVQKYRSFSKMGTDIDVPELNLTSAPPWSRLIRFVAPDGKIYYGEPILSNPNQDVGKSQEKLTAKVISGNALSDDCKVTDNVLAVKRLLGPLSRQDVPTTRCIGLNYVKHSKHTISLRFQFSDLSSQGGRQTCTTSSKFILQRIEFDCGLRRCCRNTQDMSR
jgi:hypothetical protein